MPFHASSPNRPDMANFFDKAPCNRHALRKAGTFAAPVTLPTHVRTPLPRERVERAQTCAYSLSAIAELVPRTVRPNTTHSTPRNSSASSSALAPPNTRIPRISSRDLQAELITELAESICWYPSLAKKTEERRVS
jgi:hypothetical protein